MLFDQSDHLLVGLTGLELVAKPIQRGAGPVQFSVQFPDVILEFAGLLPGRASPLGRRARGRDGVCGQDQRERGAGGGVQKGRPGALVREEL